MKKIFLIICLSFGITVTFAQTNITTPGDNKTISIQGEFLGEMIRSTGGVDKKSEKYYYSLSGGILTLWKHIHLIVEDQTETLLITSMAISDIDWPYFESSFPEGAAAKKVGGKDYYQLSINVQRGKRFKQKKYYLSAAPADVTVGNVDIDIMDADAMKAFYAKLVAAKK